MRLLITLFCLLLAFSAIAQYSDEQLLEGVYDIPEAISELIVKNHHGRVVIEGSDRSDIAYEIRMIIKARSQEKVQKGMEEMEMAWLKEDSFLVLTPDAPWIIRRDCVSQHGWTDMREKPPYDYQIDVKLVVPKGLLISAFTIDKGDVIISSIDQANTVGHVNGDIFLTDVGSIHKINSVNGNIELDGADMDFGKEELIIDTINGKILVLLSDRSDLSVHFKSMNGSFYTELPVTDKPGKILKTIKTDDGGTLYLYSQYTSVDVGRGGKDIYVETLNGNVYLKKQSK